MRRLKRKQDTENSRLRETGAELEECLKREKKESDNAEKKGQEKRNEKP